MTMAKSTRALWTQKIVDGEVKTVSRGAVWTFETAKAKSGPTRGEKLKADRAERSLRGRQMTGVVLGIDPSLRGTGLAAIESLPDGTLRYIDSLTVRNEPKLSMAQCLARILEETDAIIARTNPVCVAIEKSIYVQNFKTALILGSSRGAAIAAAAHRGLEVFEYPPLRIKQAVIGYGRASKEQVIKSVAAIVRGANELPNDEADACGAAIAHIFTHKI